MQNSITITTKPQDKDLEQEFLRDILNPLSEDINHYIQATAPITGGFIGGY